ncbi:amidase [Amycolatopsis sp. K13G38]|uniref:Amidase n=1 Tax=Amycolatopsis acididurans TaxID=2724524 RepID=A0ABX1J031_9PSEU|nr:amidase family protein [Amycolatopsis acididurans]NKQ51631.1 amidase [Amycolatopsis acididurans]
MDPARAGARELARAISASSVSSRELVRYYLDRIAASDLNAVVTLDAERALADAARADERTGPRGPLHGVPITVKDAIATAGLRTTCGSPELATHVPAEDAPAVARLRAAGAVVLGKTNTPTWCGDIQTYNEVFGVTHNPWDRTRTPGGSSGGSAAAVADGLCAFDLASDIAGSIRIPAHFCGVYGLKPSAGLVPGEGYIDHVGGGLVAADGNVLGPICRRAEDLGLVLDVLTGSPGPPARREFRAAVWLDDPACPVGSDTAAVLEEAVAALGAAGVRLARPRPPVPFEQLWQLHLDMVLAAVAYNLPDEALPPATATHRGWLARSEDRARARAAWARWFADYDVLLCPVTAMPAFPHDHAGDIGTRVIDVDGEPRPHMSTIGWCGLFSVLGLPSVVVPAGLTRDGLPVGLQVVAPHLADRTAIAFAELAGVSFADGVCAGPPSGAAGSACDREAAS